MVTSIMPLERMTDAELVRMVDNSGDATALERALASRVDAYLQKEDAHHDARYARERALKESLK